MVRGVRCFIDRATIDIFVRDQFPNTHLFERVRHRIGFNFVEKTVLLLFIGAAIRLYFIRVRKLDGLAWREVLLQLQVDFGVLGIALVGRVFNGG